MFYYVVLYFTWRVLNIYIKFQWKAYLSIDLVFILLTDWKLIFSRPVDYRRSLWFRN